jgi:adenosylcobinamide-GDP ribazoletransferase
MRAASRAVVAAITFLTRVPLGRWVAVDGADVARGAVLFPLVGAGVGAAVAGVALLAHHRLSAMLAASLAIAFGAMLTGAMHIDALADTADSIGGATPERRLEIMRDSRLGTFGVAAVGFDLLIRVAALEQLLVAGGALRAFVAAGALSRGAAVTLAALLPYPGAAGGLGSVLSGRTSAGRALAAVVLAGATAIAVAGRHGAVLLGVVAASTVLLGAWFRRWLGGANGDALGAATELGELAALVTAAAVS